MLEHQNLWCKNMFWCKSVVTTFGASTYFLVEECNLYKDLVQVHILLVEQCNLYKDLVQVHTSATTSRYTGFRPDDSAPVIQVLTNIIILIQVLTTIIIVI